MQLLVRELVEKILIEKHELSGGNCGQTIPKLMQLSSLNLKELRSVLKELYQEGKITVHPGGCGKLFKWKK